MRTIACALIVEDNDEALAWLESCLVDAFPGCVVSVARSIREARYRISSAGEDFDIALVDIGLPDGNGIELVRLLADSAPECLSVVTTIYDDDEHIFHAIAAGAGGYLLKYHETERLVELLKRILDGEPPLSPAIARRMLGALKVRPQPATDDADAAALTPREEEVLGLLGRGFQMSQVATALEISRNTAASHVKAIYRKLNISNRAEAALAAAGRGLLDS